jgi:hypothetical protein
MRVAAIVLSVSAIALLPAASATGTDPALGVQGAPPLPPINDDVLPDGELPVCAPPWGFDKGVCVGTYGGDPCVWAWFPERHFTGTCVDPASGDGRLCMTGGAGFEAEECNSLSDPLANTNCQDWVLGGLCVGAQDGWLACSWSAYHRACVDAGVGPGVGAHAGVEAQATA